MPQFLIERDVPGAGSLSAEERRAASQKSCEALAPLGARAQWQHSYFAGDKVFCVFVADGEDAIREHADRGGFPVTRIHPVSAVTDPMTAEREPCS